MSTSTEIENYQPRVQASLPAKVQYARELANSGLLPAAYRRNPGNVLYAIEYGDMLGLSPMAAITGVHIIEGKPSASAGLISALVRRAGHKLRVTGDGNSATCQIIRSDDPDYVFTVTWTLKRNTDGNPSAEEAGLANKGTWRQYPASMLKSRAITQCARDACEEALFGLHFTPEELGAEVDGDGNVIQGEVVPDAPADPVASGDQEWMTAARERAATFATDDDGRKFWDEVIAKREAGEIVTRDANEIKARIRARWKELTEQAQAADAEPVEGVIVQPPAGRQAPQAETDQEWMAEFVSAVSAAPAAEFVDGLRAELHDKLNEHRCTAEDAATLRDLLDARVTDLQPAEQGAAA